MMKKVDVLIGMQFGSEGKGLIAGHLAMSGAYDTVVNVNMPNAGHTYIMDDGTEYIFKVLPNGAVSPHVKKVMLGPDSVFDLDRLMFECHMVGSDIWNKLIIHECATILRPEHMIAEADMVARFGGTGQGSSIAMASKIVRDETAIIKFDPDTWDRYVVTDDEWMAHLQASRNILLEGCQGYSLGLNAGFYPFCTSRDCTPGRLAAGAGIPHHWIDRVIGAARIYPIRVGGNSGPAYLNQKEIEWHDIGVEPELTTVTQRQRRVFEFSHQQIKRAIIACGVTDVFLNFCNYNPQLAGIIKGSINTVLADHSTFDARVKWTGWGPKDGDIRHED